MNALVFIGDAGRGYRPRLPQSGRVGIAGRSDVSVPRGRRSGRGARVPKLARLTGGAYCPFDAGSAQQLRDLLSAVAVYAAGGRRALLEYGNNRGGDVLRLTHQMSGKG